MLHVQVTVEHPQATLVDSTTVVMTTTTTTPTPAPASETPAVEQSTVAAVTTSAAVAASSETVANSEATTSNAYHIFFFLEISLRIIVNFFHYSFTGVPQPQQVMVVQHKSPAPAHSKMDQHHVDIHQGQAYSDVFLATGFGSVGQATASGAST